MTQSPLINDRIGPRALRRSKEREKGHCFLPGALIESAHLQVWEPVDGEKHKRNSTVELIFSSLCDFTEDTGNIINCNRGARKWK